MRQILAACRGIMLPIVPSGDAQQPVRRPMTVDGLPDMIQVSNPQISPSVQ